MSLNIQSLSVVVSNKECINKCPFCVSRMTGNNEYENRMALNHPHYDINVREYLKRLKYVAGNGCQAIILTGTSEPQQNKQFLATFALLHQQIGSPFHNIEMQTTGMLLEDNRDYLRFLRNFVGVNTIALSLNSLSDEMNNAVLECKIPGKYLTVQHLCDQLKEYDFNIRICCNLTSKFNLDDNMPPAIFRHFRDNLHADQVTFRKMYTSEKDTPQGKWLSENPFPEQQHLELKSYLKTFPVIGHTVYGTEIRDVNGMSVVYDSDCMGKEPKNGALKYLILRPNCKLYSQWDSKASLVF